jgi:hypothetical protein
VRSAIGSIRKAKERPVSAALTKMIKRINFAFRKLASAFTPRRFFFLRKRRSKKSMEAPIGQT